MDKHVLYNSIFNKITSPLIIQQIENNNLDIFPIITPKKPIKSKPIPEPIPEPILEPIPEVIPEPILEPIPEPILEPILEPIPKKMYSIIPLNIFQTYNTLYLSNKIIEKIEKLKEKNPEFAYHLYDDGMCRDFIQDNFDKEIFYTFNKLKLGRCKSDLWRYCILYKYGGIYLDVKYDGVDDFKLIDLTDKEYFVRDFLDKPIQGIYNGLLVCLPNNAILLKCIKQIVENVKNDCYEYSSLYITGSHLLYQYFNSSELENLELTLNDEYGIYNKKNAQQILKAFKDQIHNNDNKKFDLFFRVYEKESMYNYPTIKPKKIKDLSGKKYNLIMGETHLFYSGTPCIIEMTDDTYLINFRWINYSIHSNGEIYNLNSTKYNNYKTYNSRFKMNLNFRQITEEVFLEEDINSELDYHFTGLEDMRIFKFNDTYYYTASIYDNNRKVVSISSSQYYIDDYNYNIEKKIILPNMYDLNKNIKWEKNWAMFKYKNELCVVYHWYPLQIGQINYEEAKLNIIDIKYNIPIYFKHARGNSCGYEKNDEIWFILHKKFGCKYQHFFAIFDLDMNLKRHSELFKFGDRIIEFCIGLIVKDSEIIVSYSLLDTQSIVAVYNLDYINNDIKWYVD
jgi:mannosyltransferase OCH1-like enzyme